MPVTITPDRIDGSFVPTPVPGLVEVSVDRELVVAAGSRVHTLNPTAALIWGCLDGRASLDTLVGDLSEATGVDEATIRRDLVEMARQLGRMGLLEGVEAEAEDTEAAGWVPVEPVAVGQHVENVELADLEGRPHQLHDLLERPLLLVNWSPTCGFCIRIGPELAGLRGDLDRNGVELALLTTGSPDLNRRICEDAGLDAQLFTRRDGADPFAGFGTPAAYLLGPAGVVSAPFAYGAGEVPALARTLAGLASGAADAEGGPRYLPTSGGACAPGASGSQTTEWLGTAVYRLGGLHVGIRYNSEPTRQVLERVLEGHAVEDPRAPDNFSLALFPEAAGARRELNLLVSEAQQLVRSRSAARTVRGLLSHLAARVAPADPSLLRLIATPAVVDGRGVLLPPDLVPWLKELQPRLTRLGIQLVDMPWSLVDPESGQLVVPEPAFPFDATAIEDLEEGARPGSELPAVPPGRYPLGASFLISAEDRWGALRPVSAVAFALPLVMEPPPGGGPEAVRAEDAGVEDASARAQRIVGLLERIPSFGLWFWTPQELVEQLSALLPDALAGLA